MEQMLVSAYIVGVDKKLSTPFSFDVHLWHERSPMQFLWGEIETGQRG